MECCLLHHRGREFVKFLSSLEKEVLPDLHVHLIVDNYSTHKSAEVGRRLKPKTCPSPNRDNGASLQIPPPKESRLGPPLWASISDP